MITRESFEKVVNALDLDITVKYMENGDYWSILVPDPEEVDEDVVLAKLYVEDLTLDIIDLNTKIDIVEDLWFSGYIDYYIRKNNIKESDTSTCPDITTCKYGCHDDCDDACYIYHILPEKELFESVIDTIRELLDIHISDLDCKSLTVHESLDAIEKK